MQEKIKVVLDVKFFNTKTCLLEICFCNKIADYRLNTVTVSLIIFILFNSLLFFLFNILLSYCYCCFVNHGQMCPCYFKSYLFIAKVKGYISFKKHILDSFCLDFILCFLSFHILFNYLDLNRVCIFIKI